MDDRREIHFDCKLTYHAAGGFGAVVLMIGGPSRCVEARIADCDAVRFVSMTMISVMGGQGAARFQMIACGHFHGGHAPARARERKRSHEDENQDSSQGTKHRM
jgi:hypothetical protein